MTFLDSSAGLGRSEYRAAVGVAGDEKAVSVAPALTRPHGPPRLAGTDLVGIGAEECPAEGQSADQYRQERL